MSRGLIGRRPLLRGLVGGSAASALTTGLAGLPWGLGGVPAAAAAGGRRLLIVYMPNCSVRNAWRPEGGLDVASGAGDPTTFKLGRACDPFEAVREHMTMIQGLDVGGVHGDPHSAAQIRIMTGGGTLNSSEPDGNLAAAPSIDQILLGKTSLLSDTPVRSLELCANTRADQDDLHHRVISFAGRKMPLAPENQPIQTFRRLFGNVEKIGGEPVAARAGGKALLERRRLQMQVLRGDLDRLKARVPGHQARKLASHLEGLRELEAALARSQVDPAASLAPLLASEFVGLAPNSDAQHPKIVDGFWRLTKAAFALDLTRVATFMFGSGNSRVNFSAFRDDLKSAYDLHPMAHDYKDEDLIAVTRWYTQVVANWVLDLATTRDASGTPLLDNTIVVLFSEVGQYHEHNDIPFAVFGGRRLGHRGGRLLRVKDRTASDVWVAIARAFGVNLERLGDEDHNKGPLPGLIG